MTSISEKIQNQTADLIAMIKALPLIDTREFGLDSQGRAGRVYVDFENREIYAGPGDIRGLNYYGGFEYIEEGEGRETLAGGWTRFYQESRDPEEDRVAECFEIYADMLADAEGGAE